MFKLLSNFIFKRTHFGFFIRVFFWEASVVSNKKVNF